MQKSHSKIKSLFRLRKNAYATTHTPGVGLWYLDSYVNWNEIEDINFQEDETLWNKIINNRFQSIREKITLLLIVSIWNLSKTYFITSTQKLLLFSYQFIQPRNKISKHNDHDKQRRKNDKFSFKKFKFLWTWEQEIQWFWFCTFMFHVKQALISSYTRYLEAKVKQHFRFICITVKPELTTTILEPQF